MSGEPTVAFLPMACLDEPAEVEHAKKTTHDGVIAMAGDARSTGVRWLIRHGREECAELFRSIWPDGKPERYEGEHGERAQYLRFFDEYEDQCALVIATCEAQS